MKLSLNAGAMEYDEESKKNKSIYIGNYSRELSAIGVRNLNALEQRKKLKEGSLIEIKKGSTRLEKFVSGRVQELENLEKEQKLKREEELKDAIYSTDIKEIRNTKKVTDLKKKKEIDLIIREMLDYEKIENFLNHRGRKLIDGSDYDKVKNILDSFTATKKDNDGIEEGKILQENGINLTTYLDDFVLIVIYAKTMCFINYRYLIELNQAIRENQRQAVRHFFSKLNESKGIDIDKIIIKGKEEKLEIDAPILVKMILYNFAELYYTYVERVDKEHWESKIVPEIIKRGNPGHDYSNKLKAIIHVFFGFIEHNKLLEGISKKRKYTLLGRLLVIAGLKEYDESRDDEVKRKKYKKGYLNEDDYYYQNLKNYWLFKKRTK